MRTSNRVWPDIAIPPGETLAEELEARGMSQTALAREMGRPVQAINEIIRGAKAITPETALQLERVLGVPGDFWVRLEADYRYNKTRLGQEQRSDRAGHLAARTRTAKAAAASRSKARSG